MTYTTQEEYLMALAEELKYLQPKDARKVLEFYQHKINVALDYGEDEEKVIASLPEVEKVAEEAYESHGVKYLELRKKQIKRKNVSKSILDIIFTIIVIFGAFFLIFLIGKSSFKIISLGVKIFKNGNLYDSITTGVGSLCYALLTLCLLIYFIDLIIIIFMMLSRSYLHLKDADKERRIRSFTITGSINEKAHKKLFGYITLGFLGVTVCLFIASFAGGGYLNHSIKGITSYEEQVNISEEVDSINITGLNYNINIHESDSLYYIYHYEFKYEIEHILNDGCLTINIPQTKSYDFLQLLDEPCQTLDLYIPSTLTDLIINCDTTNVRYYSGNLSNLNINSTTYLQCSIGSLYIDNLSVKGFDILFGLSETIVNNLVYESSKGELIFKDNVNINKFNLTNSQGSINIDDSNIKECEVVNTAGKMVINNLTNEKLDIKIRSSIANINNSLIKEIKGNITLSGSLTLEKCSGTSVLINASDSSYFIIDKAIYENMDIEGENALIFVNDLGFDYNDSGTLADCNLKITNSGNSSKTEIGTSNLKYLSLSQTNGYGLVLDTYMETSDLNFFNVNIVDLKNNTGSKSYLKMKKISDSINITSEEYSSLIYYILSWDAISDVHLQYNENVNINADEAKTNE